MSVSVSKKSLV